MAAPDQHTSLGDAPMRAAVVYVLVSGFALAFLGLAVFDLRTAAGALLGGLLATANLAVFARLGEAFLANDKRRPTLPWVPVAMLKLVVLFGSVWLILKHDLVPGLALAAGYAALPIGITLSTVFGPKPVDGDAPADRDARDERDERDARDEKR